MDDNAPERCKSLVAHSPTDNTTVPFKGVAVSPLPETVAGRALTPSSNQFPVLPHIELETKRPPQGLRKSGSDVTGTKNANTSLFQLHKETLKTVMDNVKLRLRRALGSRDMSEKDFLEDVTYLRESASYDTSRSAKRKAITDLLTTENAVLLYRNVWKHCFTKGFTNHKEYPENKQRYMLLKNSMTVLWNGTDSSQLMCEQVLASGAYKDILSYLGSKQIQPIQTTNVMTITLMKGLLGILHNVVRLTNDAHSYFRENQAVDILKKYLDASNTMVICKAEILLAYIVTEDEYDKINAGDRSLKFMIQMLDSALQYEAHYSKTYGFAADEIVEGLNRLAANDDNKVKIIKHGALPHYIKLLQPSCSSNEKKLAARGIWTLAFKCKTEILKQSGCLSGLQTLSDGDEEADVKRQVNGALWLLTGKDQSGGHEAAAADTAGQPLNNSPVGEVPHIFISYQWGSQPMMLRVSQQLKNAGYNVWMDVDGMTGSVLESMALAVEKAAVVVICMSQKYKESPNCRTEAEYTFRCRKDIIPLRLEFKYAADGWLGALVGNKLFFDFSAEEKFEKSLKGVIKELGLRGKIVSGASGANKPIAAQDSIDGKGPSTHGEIILPERAPPTNRMAPSGAKKEAEVEEWTRDDVTQWLRKACLRQPDLKSAESFFSELDGSLLMELRAVHSDAPEFYFSTLTNKAQLSLSGSLRITKLLKEL